MPRLLLDMDGTIVDLWGYPGVYDRFTAQNTDAYRYARPLVPPEVLRGYLSTLRANGWEVYICSYNAIGANRTYRVTVRDAKAEWLARYNIPYDRLLVIPYGLGKHRYKGDDYTVLIDDNADERRLASMNGNGVRAYDGAHIIAVLEAICMK